MKDKSKIIGEIKDLLFGKKEVELKFIDAKSGEDILRVEGEDFAEEMKVLLVTPEGLIPVKDGIYKLEDGRELEVLASKISKINMADEAEVNAEDEVMDMAETTLMDGTKVKVDGDVKVGNKVEVEVNGEFVKAPEGQHNLADGRVIYVDADGLINEIETPDTKVVDEDLAAVVEAAPYVNETGELVKEKPSYDDILTRLIKCEEIIAEMGSYKEKMNEFGKVIEDKIESFIKNTPAELEFKSIKSDFSSHIERGKVKQVTNLEAIKNIRAKK